jgi:glycerol uptake facilitator-like aquaporin
VKRPKEALFLLLLLILGLAPRLVFISRFPIIPVSDFSSEVDFGQYLHQHGPISNIWYWDYFNPGFPLVLCLLFTLFPHQDPVTVARLATTLWGGLLPILPFLIWRGVLPLWVRALAGAALALWPGHILFSGTVTQDNWVILPSVALAVLAVRSLLAREHPRPLTAGLLYAAGVAIRQEMLVVLFPLFLVAALVKRIRWQRAAAASLAAGLPLVALATYRYASTGRFSLRAPSSGPAILGSYVPGASVNGWIDPYAYFASVRPDLLADRHIFFDHCLQVALQEALRRPAYHAVRILSLILSSAGGRAGACTGA